MKLVSTQYSLEFSSFELYIAGCIKHPCKGCHTPELWNSNLGSEMDGVLYKNLKTEILRKSPMIEKFFITGGEILEKPKTDVITLIKFLKQFGKTIWLFSRFDIKEVDLDILKEVDFIKTGRFIKSLPPITFQEIRLFSNNQKLWKKQNGKWSEVD